jgi:ribosomal protein L37E
VLLIFGVGEREVLLATAPLACERCGIHAVHHVVKRVRKVSLFFIPLIPAGTRYLDVCTACGWTREIPRRAAAEAVALSPRSHLR